RHLGLASRAPLLGSSAFGSRWPPPLPTRRSSDLFGFGSPTGIVGLPEEAGLVPDADWKVANRGEPWYPGDAVNLSIGQGDLLIRSEEHTSELQSRDNLVCRLLLEKKKERGSAREE